MDCFAGGIYRPLALSDLPLAFFLAFGCDSAGSSCFPNLAWRSRLCSASVEYAPSSSGWCALLATATSFESTSGFWAARSFDSLGSVVRS